MPRNEHTKEWELMLLNRKHQKRKEKFFKDKNIKKMLREVKKNILHK